MSAGQPATQAELDQEFRIDPDTGLWFLDAEFRRYLCRCIKAVAPSIDPVELADVYQETFLSLVEMVRADKIDRTRPLLPLAKVVAQRRAIDFLREQGHRPERGAESASELETQNLLDSDLWLRWRCSKSDWDSFRMALREEIGKLSKKQRVVAESVVNHLGESWDEIRDEVARVTGQNETVVAVKSAWRDAKKLLAERLVRRGFNFLME